MTQQDLSLRASRGQSSLSELFGMKRNFSSAIEVELDEAPNKRLRHDRHAESTP